MQCNGNFKQWFNIFLIISEAWQRYESKVYGVLNHNLKLQSKKLSRTRDIPNFPTQGWVDTAFYMCNWSETYVFIYYTTGELFNSIYRVSFHNTYIYTNIVQVSDSHCLYGFTHRLSYAIDVVHLHIFGLLLRFCSKQERFLFTLRCYTWFSYCESPPGPSLFWATVNITHFKGLVFVSYIT